LQKILVLSTNLPEKRQWLSKIGLLEIGRLWEGKDESERNEREVLQSAAE
jgi:hypothetical protein